MDIDILKDLAKNINLGKEAKEFGKVVEGVVLNGAQYVIKALPIQENVKDVLVDVAKVLKTKDFSKIVDTAITSSIKEGMEFLGIKSISKANVREVLDIAKKGGLRENLCATFDITFKPFIANNLFGDTISKFVDDVKTFLGGKSFDVAMNKAIDKIIAAKEKVKNVFNKWEEAYKNFNLKDVTEIFKSMSTFNKTINQDHLLTEQYNQIKNIMDFVKINQCKLTDTQYNFCKNI